MHGIFKYACMHGVCMNVRRLLHLITLEFYEVLVKKPATKK